MLTLQFSQSIKIQYNVVYNFEFQQAAPHHYSITE